MKKSHIILSIVMAAIIAATVGWKIAYPTNSFRYKVTVNVETPEGLKSGFAVREFEVRQQPELWPEIGPLNFVRGEAVVVDLGERGTLFALIDADDEYLVFNTFPTAKGELTRDGMRYYEELQAKTILEPRNYPLLVTFKDAHDPKTIAIAYKPLLEASQYKTRGQPQLVDIEDRMSELFGAGVLLKNITIEMTKEQITWRINNYLPSFGPETGFKDWFQKLKYDDPKRLTRDNFISGNRE